MNAFSIVMLMCAAVFAYAIFSPPPAPGDGPDLFGMWPLGVIVFGGWYLARRANRKQWERDYGDKDEDG